jgi:hypothetical protein
MMERTVVLSFAAGLLLNLLAAQQAAAQADQTLITVISEATGFPGACEQPCYEIEKQVDVYLAGTPPPLEYVVPVKIHTSIPSPI